MRFQYRKLTDKEEESHQFTTQSRLKEQAIQARDTCLNILGQKKCLKYSFFNQKED